MYLADERRAVLERRPQQPPDAVRRGDAARSPSRSSRRTSAMGTRSIETAWSSPASTEPVRWCGGGPTGGERRSPIASTATGSTARTMSSSHRTARCGSPTRPTGSTPTPRGIRPRARSDRATCTASTRTTGDGHRRDHRHGAPERPRVLARRATAVRGRHRCQPCRGRPASHPRVRRRPTGVSLAAVPCGRPAPRACSTASGSTPTAGSGRAASRASTATWRTARCSGTIRLPEVCANVEFGGRRSLDALHDREHVAVLDPNSASQVGERRSSGVGARRRPDRFGGPARSRVAGWPVPVPGRPAERRCAR